MVKIDAPFTVRDIESAVLQGREAERERIIALLEKDCAEDIVDNRQGCFHEVTIALIKGENE